MITLSYGKPGQGMTLDWVRIEQRFDNKPSISASGTASADRRGDPLAGSGCKREAHPVGNTGTTSQPHPARHGEANPVISGGSNRG